MKTSFNTKSYVSYPKNIEMFFDAKDVLHTIGNPSSQYPTALRIDIEYHSIWSVNGEPVAAILWGENFEVKDCYYLIRIKDSCRTSEINGMSFYDFFDKYGDKEKRQPYIMEREVKTINFSFKPNSL